MMMDLLKIEETWREALGKPQQRAPEVHAVLGTEAWNLAHKKLQTAKSEPDPARKFHTAICETGRGERREENWTLNKPY